MKEQFDKVLRDHIKDTFDEYNDGLAHDGWLHYQKKTRNKKRKAFLLWSLPSGIAASILFILFFNNNISKQDDVTNKLVDGKELNMSGNFQKSTEDRLLRPSIPLNKTLAKKSAYPLSKEKVRQISPSDKKVFLENTEQQVVNPANSIPNVSENTSTNNHSNDDLKSTEHIVTTNNTSAHATSILENTKSLFEEEEPPTYADVYQNPTSSFGYDKGGKTRMAFKNKLKNVKLSLDASTYVNFSDAGLNDQINLAVGVVSEYRITKKLSIHSGINVNRQSSSFTHEVPVSQDNVTTAMSLTNSVASIVNGQFTNARLVGLDIPLNIKYSTNNKKLNWFVSSGISSYALVNEKYFNSFSVTRFAFTGVETSTVSTVEEHTESPISSFQFARSLNFSVGFAFPMKKVTTLSVEPFIKYPLKQFGQQNLALGSGGVSLKIELNKGLFKN